MAGDVEAARVANEALGRLLGATGAQPGAVVDLAAERERRAGGLQHRAGSTVGAPLGSLQKGSGPRRRRLPGSHDKV